MMPWDAVGQFISWCAEVGVLTVCMAFLNWYPQGTQLSPHMIPSPSRNVLLSFSLQFGDQVRAWPGAR